MKLILYVCMLCILLMGCKEANNSTQQTTENTVQQAWDEMMVIHDEVMPKMSEINRLKKQLVAQGDTTIVYENLQKAEDGMWDWMHNLVSLEEVKKMEEAAAMQHLRAEIAEITEVREEMQESIEAGEQLLTKNDTK
ncbi:MAG: hypothetical protein AAF849_20460 [Bacteroidota bacterium]